MNRLWSVSLALLCLTPALRAQSVREFVLDEYQPTSLSVSREVTVLTFPGAIAGVAGADMAMDNERAANGETDEATARFQVSHLTGSNFILIRSLQLDARGTLTVLYQSKAYVIELTTVVSKPVASAIFRNGAPARPTSLVLPPASASDDSRIVVSLLDRARLFPLLAKSVPQLVEGATCKLHNEKVSLPLVDVELREVCRFSNEGALVFLTSVRNTSDQPVVIDPKTFAVRVGSQSLLQAAARGPQTLRPGESAEAEFAVVGDRRGLWNDVSADNAFTISVTAKAITSSESPLPEKRGTQ